MRQAVVAACVVALMAAGAGLSGPVSGDSPPGGDIAIAVAPGTIALNSEAVWLTVHADIPYAAVAGVAVAVNGTEVTVTRTFADSVGDLVVKCPIDEVKGIVGGASSATVVLSGITKADEPFTGSDTVKVTGGGRK